MTLTSSSDLKTWEKAENVTQSNDWHSGRIDMDRDVGKLRSIGDSPVFESADYACRHKLNQMHDVIRQ